MIISRPDLICVERVNLILFACLFLLFYHRQQTNKQTGTKTTLLDGAVA